MTRRRLRLPRLARTTEGLIGMIILAVVVGMALFGPLLAPDPPDVTLGPPGLPATADAPLGSDYLGRDAFSRLLHGGLPVLWMSIAATGASYLLGLAVGLVAGYNRSLLDPLLMRGTDVLLSLPALLLILLFVGGFGASIGILILGVALVQMPGIARMMRTATLEASTRGYVEAAVARGERSRWVLTREILPNITPVLLADFGVRFGYSIILIASMNYLGFGLQPPASDWGLMISENRDIISLNLWAVLAPAIMLGLLTIGVNLVADAYVRVSAQSSFAGSRRKRGRLPTAGVDEGPTGETPAPGTVQASG